jgi:DNA mismatch endonuclease, patch repair protein
VARKEPFEGVRLTSDMIKSLPSFNRPNDVRSANMRAIRATGNRSTEWRLRSLLIRNEIRGWKVHSKQFLGTPDFAFPESKILIFIDGCYWHGCPNCGHIPRTNSEYWTAKIGRNQVRDKKYTRELRKQGFKVIRIWECNLKKHPARVLRCIQKAISL